MHVLIIGAAGMVGRKLTDRLVAEKVLNGREITRFTLADVVEPAAPNGFTGKVSTLTADLSSAGIGRGLIDERPAVVLEHVTRLRDNLCPGWPQPAQPGGSYRVEITGEPSYAMDLCLSSPNGDHNHAGLVATAMRVVNAVPAVVAAEPGIRTTLNLPLITGSGLYAP